MLQRSRFFLASGMLCGLLIQQSLCAQQAAQQTEQIDQPVNVVLTRQLLEHARRGYTQAAEAISQLARLGNWTQVDQIVRQLGMQGLSPEQQAEVASRLGPALFLRIQQSEKISDQARQTLRNLSQAAIAQAESPDRLQKAIAGLASPSTDTRLASARTLIGGGNAAIAELVSAVVSENPAAPRDELLKMMLRLGEGGTQALRQLSLYGQPELRHRAVSALARIDRRAHIVELLTALFASDATEAEISTATSHLNRISDDLPSPGSAAAMLTLDFRDRREQARRATNDDYTATLWRVNDECNGVSYQSATRIMKAYREVVDAGMRLHRVGGLSSDLQGQILAADMAYRMLIDPDWGDVEQMDQVRQLYGDAARGSALATAIDQALASGDHAAVAGLVNLIDAESATVLDRGLFLQGSGAVATPLVRGASSAEPRVRYDSALAAARLAQGAPFTGSTTVLRTLSEMRGLSHRPTAILVETRSEVIVQLETLLGNLGFDVLVTPTVGQLQRVVARGGDIRVILSKTELADLPPIELVDRVRRIDRGAEIPIVFYGTEPPGLQEVRWDAPTVVIDRPATPAGLNGAMDVIRRKRRLPQLSEIDRQAYRQAAIELLEAGADG